MALQREQIDTLLAEIDGVLSKANPRLPWVMSSEVTQQRQTLERIRHYLTGLQAEPALSSLDPSGYRSWPDVPPTHLEVSSGALTEQANSPQAALNLSQQMIQAFTQDLAQLRSSLLQPLHAETVRLQQQRDSLLQEIRQLERQRQQHTLIQQRASQEQQVYDFLQGLMDRLQERLSQQINQVVGTLAAQAKAGEGALVLDSASGGTLFPQEAGLPPLPAAQRVEQLQMLQARADQVMMTLDTTLRAFAEALQQNIQSYESSLSQGLDKMHSMGQQGEAIVANLVQKLADQVSGQVLSGQGFSDVVPSLPASPGNRLQGLNAQNTGQARGLSPSQHFSTYTTPDASSSPGSGSNQNSGQSPIPPRFGLPLTKPSQPSPLGSSGVPGSPLRQPVEPVTTVNSRVSNVTVTSTDADLEALDWGDTPTGLDLDLDLLEQLEQTAVDSSRADQALTDQILTDQTDQSLTDQTLAVPQGESGNEELDAFYASLFGDTNRKPEPIELPLELEAEGVAGSALDRGAIPDLEISARLEIPQDDLKIDDRLDDDDLDLLDDEGISDADPFANLGSLEGEAPLDLDLLDDGEPEATSPETRDSKTPRPQDLSPEPNPAPQTGFGAAMDPLAALSLELQAPFQGVTDLSPQRPGLSAPSSPSEDSLTDPLMADLEEALQSFGSGAFSPSLPPKITIPEITTQIPMPQESEAVPPEDVIKSLTEVMDWVTEDDRPRSTPTMLPTIAPRETVAPQKPEVSLIPAPSSTPEPVGDFEDEIYHLAHPEETLLVKDEVENEAQMDLHLEPEMLQQLTEDLSNLERQTPVESEDLFSLDGLDQGNQFGDDEFGDEFGEGIGDDRFGTDQFGTNQFRDEETLEMDGLEEDVFGEAFDESIPTPDLFSLPHREPQNNALGSEAGMSEEALGILENGLEQSSPDESLLPDAEDNGLDWLLEEPPAPSPSVAPRLSFDLFADAAFDSKLERNLEQNLDSNRGQNPEQDSERDPKEDLDLDSSFEESSELSLDRMTDWFGDEPESPSEELFLIDHLFADLPDAEKKNDWSDWDL